MNNFISEFYEYTAYAVFILAWAVSLFLARHYNRLGKTAQSNPQKDKSNSVLPPVSIIITAHNQGIYLKENLKHFLEQDYDNFEVIVVNCASTDNTEDIIKQYELIYPNLHHTFVPQNARYVSMERLSLTIGAKSARNEWLIFSAANCRPYSNKWLSAMARHFNGTTNIVLGYVGRDKDERDFAKKAWFQLLFNQMCYLTHAAGHKAYRSHPGNIAYRKSFFMEHKGFAEDVNLLYGATDILINRHSTKENTEVCVSCEAKVITELPVRKKLWIQERVNYMETRKSFKNTFGYRLNFNLLQVIPHVLNLATLISLAISVIRNEWIVTGCILLLAIIMWILKYKSFKTTTDALHERNIGISLFYYEGMILMWNISAFIKHLFTPKKQFRRKGI